MIGKHEEFHRIFGEEAPCHGCYRAQRNRERLSITRQANDMVDKLGDDWDTPECGGEPVEQQPEPVSREELAAILADTYGMPGHPDHLHAAGMLLPRFTITRKQGEPKTCV